MHGRNTNGEGAIIEPTTRKGIDISKLSEDYTDAEGFFIEVVGTSNVNLDVTMLSDHREVQEFAPGITMVLVKTIHYDTSDAVKVYALC